MNLIYHKTKFKFISSFFFTLLFFPSVTFGLYSAEIFPWAIIVSLLYMRKYNYYFILLIGYLVMSTIFTIIINNGSSLILFESIRSLGAYLNSLFVFALILSLPFLSILKLIKLSRIIFIVLLGLGILQITGLIEVLDPIFKFLVPRSTATDLSFMVNRGVTLLSSEPARAGNLLIFLYILIRTVYISGKTKVLTDILFSLYLLLIIKSSMSIMLYMCFILIVYRMKLLLPSTVFIIVIFTLDLDMNTSSRAVELFISLNKLDSLNEVLFTIINTSGHRLISIYSSFLYGVHIPLGGGIGNWMSSSIDALNLTNIDLSLLNYFKLYGNGNAVSIRSSGFISNLILDIGIIGVFLFCCYLFISIFKFWNISEESKIIIIIFLLKIFFVGSVGHPVAWITTILCLRYLYEMKRTTQIIP